MRIGVGESGGVMGGESNMSVTDAMDLRAG